MIRRRWIVSSKKFEETNEVLLPPEAVPIHITLSQYNEPVRVWYMIPKDLEEIEVKAR